MAINISSQNLFPVRRDKQIAPSTGAISYGSGGGSGSVDSSIDLSGYITEASINVGSWLSHDFVWTSGEICINNFLYPIGGGTAVKEASLGMSYFNWNASTLSITDYVSKTYVDGSLAIRDARITAIDSSLNDSYSAESFFIPEASFNDSYFKWNGGYLEPSIAGGTGDVTKLYVDGSLALRDTRITAINASIGYIDSIDTYVNSSTYYDGSLNTKTSFTYVDGSLGARQKLKYTALSAGTTAMAFATNITVKVTPNANATYTTTVPAAGQMCTLIILTSGTSSYTITFGSGFKSTGALASGTTTARVFVIHWISDGTNLYESGRTAAMVA